MPEPSTTNLQCLQVWGGTEAADQTLRMTGLDGYLYARPYEGAKRGGDVYYVSSCASGRITRALLADVAGHGSKVAETAQDLRSLMQYYVNFTSQQLFMRAMNQKFAEITEAGRFATTVAMSYFAPKRRLSLSNAGHPAPLWYRAKSRRWSVLGMDPSDETSEATADLPLGIADDAGYQQVDITFGVGDLLLLYTDALIESRGPDGRMLGVGGLLDRLNRLEVGEAERVIPTLIERLAEDDAHDLADDDVTVLLIQANGTKNEWRKLALAPFYAIRG
ncbi:MAG: serine/threonine-protein phosphatase, partial [Verrucomicrobiales bacterium]|nr:serine/threonine-protein phosphatase [Verrucomicrobiales bacterium]